MIRTRTQQTKHRGPFPVKTLAGLLVLLLTASHAICDETSEFTKALNNGTETKMILRIVDADGVPVPDAEVEFGFWNNHSQGGFKNTFTRSGTNGECVVSGRCNGSCVWNVAKPGYYSSHAEWSLSDTRAMPKVVGGKWQPYGETKEIVLKEIIAPVDMPGLEYTLIECPAFDKWLGFDLGCCSWVEPYGNGSHPDVLVRLHEDGSGDTAFSATMDLCFTNNPHAGAYVLRKDGDSEMKSVYHADANAAYESRLAYSLSVDSVGRRNENGLDEDSYLVLRTRTEVDKDGNLVSAHYGKIYGKWEFYGGMRAEAIFFNPTPNDTNLEDAKTAERSLQRQRQRESPPRKKKRWTFWPFRKEATGQSP